MTIEIKQLIIRAVADPGRDRSKSTAPTMAHDSAIPRGPSASFRDDVHPAALADQREAIIAACVREVLRKLERSRDR
jgi:hypothetical protein